MEAATAPTTGDIAYIPGTSDSDSVAAESLQFALYLNDAEGEMEQNRNSRDFDFNTETNEKIGRDSNNLTAELVYIYI